jgi:hypothetical protein
MKSLPLAFSFFLMFSTSASAITEPTFDCTTAETKIYIEQVTHSIFAPSSIPTAEEFMDAYIEGEQAKADAGDDDAKSCVSIFTDGTVNEDWKDLVDAVRSLDIDFTFSGPDAAARAAFIKKLKDKVQEQLMSAMEELGQDVCAMLQTDALKAMLLKKVNDKYGLNARNLRIKDFADSVSDEVMRNAPDEIQMLLSDKEFFKAVDAETKSEINKARKSLWQNF